MGMRSLLFGFNGRINRALYWLAYFIWSIVAAAVYFALKVILVATGLDNSTATLLGIGLLIYLPFMVSAVAIILKRLHDRNKGGAWLAFYFLAPVVLSFVIYAIAGTNPDQSDAARLLQVVILGIYVVMLIDLGCLRGTAGGNRYGPDSLATT